MELETIQRVAIAELLDPTFAITEQLLEVHTLVLKEGVPCIEDIILNEQEKDAEVYFRIEGERYYLVMYVDLEPKIRVRGVDITAGNLVYLQVVSTLSQEELVRLADMEELTRTWKERVPMSHSRFLVPSSPKGIKGDVEDKLSTLLKVLQPYKANIQLLAARKDVVIGIRISYYGYNGWKPDIQFDQETIQELAAFNLYVDIDLYASGPDLKS